MSTTDSVTRREFIAATSFAAGSIVVGPRAHAQSQRFPLSRANAAHSASAFLPELLSPYALRNLAASALDAAHAAGASYADVRVAEQQRLAISSGGGATPNSVRMVPEFMYGLRVLVNGAWGFYHGTVASTDALATAASTAVTTARVSAKMSVMPEITRPLAAVVGSWETPYVLDPFTVPIADQCALASACAVAVGRVRHSTPSGAYFDWRRETRVFASTEGAQLTQTFRRSYGVASTRVSLPIVTEPISVQMLQPMSGGYECVTMPQLQDDLKHKTEELEPLLWLPHRTLDVGRYEIVMDGASLGQLFISTLGKAGEFDRVLGHELTGSGGSYLSPATEFLGTMVANPLLTANAHRNSPTVMAAKWDDDGIESRPFSIIRDGRLTNYVTSRHTAIHHPGQPVSTGCAVADDADDPVLVRLPHVAISSVPGAASVQDLCKDIRHGLYIQHDSEDVTMTDAQLSSGMLRPAVMFEIRNGQLVSRVKGNALQFRTPRLWNALAALGSSSTVQPCFLRAGKGMPNADFVHTASAPAAYFKECDVINTNFHL